MGKKRRSGTKIDRLYFINPSVGEQYFLPVLLMIVKGAKSYKEVRTSQGIVHNTFKEACAARGLLGDDTEWCQSLEEASIWATSYQLRHLFVTMLLFCDINDERSLFEKVWLYLADDFQYRLRRATGDTSYIMPASDLRDNLLDELSTLLARNGSKISYFNLPTKSVHRRTSFLNTMVNDELLYDAQKLPIESESLHNKLNPDKKRAFDRIVLCVTHK